MAETTVNGVTEAEPNESATQEGASQDAPEAAKPPINVEDLPPSLSA